MKRPSAQDSIYAQPLEAISQFVFDESVAQVFQDMVRRSVPGYNTLLSMLPVLMQQYAQDGSRCYDLGSSLGASTLAMRHGAKGLDVEIIAVDNSPAMIEQSREMIANDAANVPVELLCDDVQNIEIEQASVVVMNFTLQFIPLSQRLDLLRKIYQGLKPGGIFVLSEKILINNNEQQDWMTQLHHAFKKANGYSDLEIAQKRSALENVLVAETRDEHHQRLQQAGFSKIIDWYQCFNFVSILAQK